MDWKDERYVRLYTRDTADWLCLSFIAQGLFALLTRKVDRAGVLPLGRAGRKAVAIAIGHAHQWPMLEPGLDELLADGCVQIVGDNLVIPNFLEAQEAEASDKARARNSREKRRDTLRLGAITGVGQPPDDVTLASQDVTQASRDVTGHHDTRAPRDGGVTERVTTITPSRTVPPEPPVPPEQQQQAAVVVAESRLPSRDQLLARTCPATAALIDASDGQFAFPAEAKTRDTIERAIAAAGTQRAIAAARRSYEKTPKEHLGWHKDALLAAAVEARAEAVAPSLPILDLAWLDQLPEPRRTEARAAWEAKQSELEAMHIDTGAAPRWLAAGAELLRQQFTQQASEAAP